MDCYLSSFLLLLTLQQKANIEGYNPNYKAYNDGAFKLQNT